MLNFKKNKFILIISLFALLFLNMGCEMNFYPNETLYVTPYGKICLDDYFWDTTYLLSVPNEDLYYLATILKIDAGERLISHNISNDLSKFYVLIGNSHARWKPKGIGLFVFDITDPINNTYSYSPRINNALKPIIEITDKDITEVSIFNDSITYTESSGGNTTIIFSSL